MSNLRRNFRVGRSPFDDIMHLEDDGTEWWSARQMAEPLGYARWENLESVIRRARSACRNSNQDPSEHFREFTKMFPGANGSQRKSYDVQMTRLGCYFLAMNGDPDKPEIAAAQRYFVMMTRAAELDVPAPPAPIPKPWSERFRETMLSHLRHVNIYHPGCFTVVTTLVAPILYLEDELVRHMLRPQPSDRPDVSIGLCWSNDRKRRGLPAAERTAPLRLPDQAIDVELRCYENSERGACESWFAHVYLREKLPEYLTRKKSFAEFGELPPASAADSTCRGLTGREAVLKPPIRRQLAAVGGFFPVGAKLPELPGSQPSLFDEMQ